MKHYGLIGKGLGHSFSSDYFNQRFTKEALDASYQNIEVNEIDDLREVLSGDFDGMNVTMPYKESILPFLSDIDEEAAQIGAVNCLKRIPGGWKGYNTDAYGFKESLRPVLKHNHQKALILGTGGASKAVAYVLKGLGLDILFISRTPEQGQLSYRDLNEKALQYFPFIINCTPLGTFPELTTCPDIPYEALTAKNLLYDLIYNPEETEFLKRGRANGAHVMNGKKMLIYQAERSWEIWSNLN